MQVAVDGPAGSGKSTVCKRVAIDNNLMYLDTGAMYRSVAYLSLKFDRDKLLDILESVEFIFSDNGSKLSLKSYEEVEDVTDIIRSSEITAIVSTVSSDELIRKILTVKQQIIASSNDIIMEGRDITTVVLPNADVKIFLTASVEERAKRRYAEVQGVTDKSYDEILADIIKRDDVDSNRDIAPLIKSDDSHALDTTALTLDEVIFEIGKLIVEKRG